jgi:hypothetical protein
MKFNLIILFFSFVNSWFFQIEQDNNKIISTEIKFRYHNSVNKNETFEGTNYFDNCGQKTLIVFKKKKSTDLLKILKIDSLEYDFPPGTPRSSPNCNQGHT